MPSLGLPRALVGEVGEAAPDRPGVDETQGARVAGLPEQALPRAERDGKDSQPQLVDQALARARAGHEDAFRELTDPYRRKLQHLSPPQRAVLVPVFGVYFAPVHTEIARLYGMVVLTLEARQISAITWFGGNSAFPLRAAADTPTGNTLGEMTHSFVPDDYVVPLTLSGPGFHLEPLGPQHNDADHHAWMSSIEHIRATPGFSTGRWPPAGGMSLDENLRDLRRHADDFERRVGFTYTVLDDHDVVVGCVYIYPSKADPGITEVWSWVTAARAELDSVLHEAVDGWLAADWPFTDVRYPDRV